MMDLKILSLEKKVLKQICSHIFQDYALVYLITDKAGKIIQWGGNFSGLKIKTPEKESSISDVMLFMEGILPLKNDSMEFSCIKMPFDLCVDALLFKIDNCYGLIVWDATKKEKYLAKTQQHNNELSLLKQEKNHIIQNIPEENILVNLARALNFAVMEMNDQGNFRLIGTPPPWIDYIFDSNQILFGQAYEEDVFSFLGNFIQEVKSKWAKDHTGSFKSGIWIEKDDTGQDFLFETTAVDIDGRKLLIIAHDLCHPDEKQSILQKGRSLALKYHNLKRTDQKLKSEHDALELYVKERTKDLKEANLRLERELDQRKKAEREREEVSKQLRQSQKMEAIGTLAGGIAHDFNNILSGIFGYAHLVSMEIDGSGQAKHYVGQIIKGAQRASALVQQILTFSRQAEHEKLPLGIAVVINEAIDLLRASIPSTIEIRGKIFSQKNILADPTQIHQVIMNLCTNAYHAMSDTNGVLEIRLEDVTITYEESIPELKKLPGEYLKLEVSDTGCGMDKKIIERIFDPYFSTKKQGEGTGLGLALVQAIVDDHNGFLEVDTQLDKGTNFSIYFPVIGDIDIPLPSLANDPSLFKGNEKIMIVDDEESIRYVLKDILERYGYTVNAFENGFEALKAFKKDPDYFDLIITDMTMPKISGDELAIELLGIRPDLKIILCTGYGEKMIKTKAIEAGVRRYIQKPITNIDLTKLVREVLDTK